MPNHDQVNLRYYGLINSEDSHEATQYRVHWICKQVTGRKVLDIGCSQGIVPILLGREGFLVTGIDIEETSIQYANEELSRESVLVQDKVSFLLQDVTSLDRSLGTFDTVILSEVLEHFSHPRRILSIIYRLLNRKGKIIITVPFGLLKFHDHKQTFYAGNLSYYLEPYFVEVKLEVHHKYICYVGLKREQGKSYNAIEYTGAQLKKWIKIDEENFLSIEEKNYRLVQKLKQRLVLKEKQIKELQNQTNRCEKG